MPHGGEPAPSFDDARLLSAIIETQNDIVAVELDPPVVAQTIVERAQSLTGADAAVIDLIEADETVHWAASGFAAGCLGQRLKIGSSLSGLAVREQSILHCEDSETDPRVDREACRRSGTRSMIVVPLLQDGRVTGLLRVMSRVPSAFGRTQAAALRLMAGFVCATLRNAAEMQEKRRVLDERATALAALHESEQRFRLAFEHAPAGMGLVSLGGTWVQVNPAVSQIFGYSERELLAGNLEPIADPLELRAALVDRDLATGRGLFKAVRSYHHKHGRPLWVLLSVSLLRGERGQPLYYIAHMQDMTDRRLSEAVEAERTAVLEMVAQHRPLQEILTRLARLVEQQIAGVRAGIVLLSQGELQPIAPDVPDDVIGAMKPRLVGLAAALCAYDVGHQPQVRTSALATEPVWAPVREHATHRGLQCCWSLPVRAADATFLAMLFVFTGRVREPGPAEMHALDSTGRLAAIAIEHGEMTARLGHHAQHDPLTGLPNRVLFLDRLDQALANARRNSGRTALLAIDLDRFKSVNDTLGHQAGDELLQQCAIRWKASLRATDTLARIGGDEFMLVLPQLKARVDAQQVAQKLLRRMADPVRVAERPINVTGSIGIATFPENGEDSIALQQQADAALYRAKQAGRNCYAWAGDGQ